MPGSTKVKFEQVPERVKKYDMVDTSDSLNICMLKIKDSNVRCRSVKTSSVCVNGGNSSDRPSAVMKDPAAKQ